MVFVPRNNHLPVLKNDVPLEGPSKRDVRNMGRPTLLVVPNSSSGGVCLQRAALRTSVRDDIARAGGWGWWTWVSSFYFLGWVSCQVLRNRRFSSFLFPSSIIVQHARHSQHAPQAHRSLQCLFSASSPREIFSCVKSLSGIKNFASAI